jgi:hypothetical protein
MLKDLALRLNKKITDLGVKIEEEDLFTTKKNEEMLMITKLYAFKIEENLRSVLGKMLEPIVVLQDFS